MHYRIPEGIDCIDAHNHVAPQADGTLNRIRAQELLDGAERLGINRLCVSRPLLGTSHTKAEIEKTNDVVFTAMEMSERFLGFAFVDPGNKNCLKEVERCVHGGMVGIKLYHQYLICSEVQRSLLELAGELHVPVLMHAGKVCDAATRARQPRLSNAEHFLKACKLFPETDLIQGHIGGGGDWEWNLRLLEQRPGSYIDISGSVIDAGIVRRTIDAIGIERVLFATDGILEEGVGKLLAAKLSFAEMKMICQDNFERLLAKQNQ